MERALEALQFKLMLHHKLQRIARRDMLQITNLSKANPTMRSTRLLQTTNSVEDETKN